MSNDKKTGEMVFKTTTLRSTNDENYRVKTFELDTTLNVKPGQFAMVWVPKVGERPFSILSGNPLSFTIANVGNVSEALHKLKAGGRVSFRGPLGNGFKLGKEKKILLVGGGYGVVPLYFLAKESKGKDITMIIGARNEKDIIFEEKFKAIGVKTIVATDDGSKGFKGNAVEAANHEGLGKYDCVLSCGPEKMMYYLALACDEAKVPSQLSLERYMKCGFGICGSCDLDGLSVCRDGPVFSGKEALKLAEFGKEKRAPDGKMEKL